MKIIYLNSDDGVLRIEPLGNAHIRFEFSREIDPQDSGMGRETKAFLLDWDEGQELFQFLKELGHYYVKHTEQTDT